MPGRNGKGWLLNGIKIVVTLVLLAVVALTVDVRQIWHALRAARWEEMVLALGLYQVGMLVRAYRWQALLDEQGAHLRWGQLVGLYYVGAFFNSFLPSGFGGDLVKMHELSRQGPSGAVAVSTVLMDRALGLLALLAMALIVLPFGYVLIPASVTWSILGLSLGGALGVWLLWDRRIVRVLAARVGLVHRILEHRQVAAFYAALHACTGRGLLRSSLASFLFNIILILTQICLARALGIIISPIYFFLFVPIISSLLALPFSISGFGVREGGYVLLFGQAGVPAERAVGLSLLFYALNVVTGMIGGVCYLVQNARKPHPS